MSPIPSGNQNGGVSAHTMKSMQLTITAFCKVGGMTSQSFFRVTRCLQAGHKLELCE